MLLFGQWLILMNIHYLTSFPITTPPVVLLNLKWSKEKAFVYEEYTKLLLWITDEHLKEHVMCIFMLFPLKWSFLLSFIVTLIINYFLNWFWSSCLFRMTISLGQHHLGFLIHIQFEPHNLCRKNKQNLKQIILRYLTIQILCHICWPKKYRCFCNLFIFFMLNKHINSKH